MVPVNLVSLAATLLVLWAYFRPGIKWDMGAQILLLIFAAVCLAVYLPAEDRPALRAKFVRFAARVQPWSTRRAPRSAGGPVPRAVPGVG